MNKKTVSFIITTAILLHTVSALAAGAIPDHKGTSMSGFEIGTAQLNSAVKSYASIFAKAGDQYGVDPNILAAICMQESSGINYSYRADGTSYPAWGIMQIQYTNEKTFADFGLKTTGTAWTLDDRLDPEKAVPFAAWFISTMIIRYDCDYMKVIQGYNFGETVLNKIIAAKGDDWLSERVNAVRYAVNYTNPTYGDAKYIEHVLRYYHNDIEYKGAKVRVNGKLISFDSQYPLIEDGHTYIPVRAVAETLGAAVSWDQSSSSATISSGSSTILIPTGKDHAFVNGKKTALDAAAIVINNRTMVPLRFITEAFGDTVDWDGDTRTVEITTQAN